MDNDDQLLGNSPGDDNRGRLHTKIANTDSEPVPVKLTGLVIGVETHLTRLRLKNQAIYRVSDGREVRTLFGQSTDVTVISGGFVEITSE